MFINDKTKINKANMKGYCRKCKELTVLREVTHNTERPPVKGLYCVRCNFGKSFPIAAPWAIVQRAARKQIIKDTLTKLDKAVRFFKRLKSFFTGTKVRNKFDTRILRGQ